MGKQLQVLIAAGLIIASTISTGRAEILRVDSAADIDANCANHLTIQAALDAASLGDEIIVFPGVNGRYEEGDLHFPTNDVHLRSQTGHPSLVTIDAMGSDRVFNLSNNTGVVIEGFTITGGDAGTGRGGGIKCYDGLPPSVTFINCVITGNTAADGGGVYVWNCSPTFKRCTFQDNTVTGGAGGGAYCLNAYPYTTDPVFETCTFVNNSATDEGGGIYCSGTAHAHLIGVVFGGNSATIFGGGGVYVHGAGTSIRFDSCVIQNNTALGLCDDGAVAAGASVEFNACDWTLSKWCFTGTYTEPNDPGVPCMNESYATYACNPTAVSVPISPAGGASFLDVYEFGGSTTDATITVTINNHAGNAISGISADDIWIATSDGGIELCREADSGPDGPTGATGETTFSGSVHGGGYSNWDSEKCIIMTKWGKVNGTKPGT
ncbi:MAG: hypothetical protein ABIF77_00565, partial [bacterium]